MREAVYFSHDSNAKDDPKCMLLIDQLGLEGYGAFWILVEVLREQPGYRYPLNLLPILARRYNITAVKLETVVRSFGLFEISDDTFFFSNSLNKRMEIMSDKTDRRKASALKANEVRWNKQKALSASDPNGVRTESDFIQKERKGNEIKKEIYKEKAIAFVPPIVGDVYAYCKERNNSIDAEYFVDFYTSRGWMAGKNKMKDWRAAVRLWERSENNKSENNGDKQKNTGKRYKLL